VPVAELWPQLRLKLAATKKMNQPGQAEAFREAVMIVGLAKSRSADGPRHVTFCFLVPARGDLKLFARFVNASLRMRSLKKTFHGNLRRSFWHRAERL
jgi:hypothetical protein